MTFRFSGTALLAATTLIGLGASSAHAQLTTITKTGSVTGINSSFGGVVGTGSNLTLNQASTASSVVNIAFTKGAGAINDIGVIYIATQNTLATGFNSTATLTDSTDGGRSAVSGFDGTNRSALTFATGFTADYALAFGNNFSVLFGLNTGTLNFIAPTGIPTNTANGFSYDLDLTKIGLVRGQSFDFVTTYVSTSAFRSNEFIGVASGNFAAGNIGQAPANLPANSFVRYVSATATAVPEAGALPLALSALTLLGAVVVRRRAN